MSVRGGIFLFKSLRRIYGGISNTVIFSIPRIHLLSVYPRNGYDHQVTTSYSGLILRKCMFYELCIIESVAHHLRIKNILKVVIQYSPTSKRTLLSLRVSKNHPLVLLI